MRQHDRYKLEAKARVKIDQLMFEMDLTLGEQVRVLSRLLSDAGKYIVRHERHGDYSTPADEAQQREAPNG